MSVVPLSIGVVLPTLNCIRLLPDHLETMRPWLDSVSEVVVVDSHSDDGTEQMIRERLRHPRLTFHQRPRGLYQAWNFGLAQLQTKYAYVSTVGDSITRDGLEHLYQVAERFGCDAVVSKPRFIDADGAPVKKQIRWPIDDVLATVQLSEPTAVEGLRLFLLLVCNTQQAILGSSASDLYRTQVLKERPFPVEFGMAGDVAWGLANALDVRIGVTTRQFSTFRHHPKSYALSDYAVANLKGKLFDLAASSLERRTASDARLHAEVLRLDCAELMRLLRLQLEHQERLEAARRRGPAWIFNPAAWRARAARNQMRREVKTRMASMVHALDLAPAAIE